MVFTQRNMTLPKYVMSQILGYLLVCLAILFVIKIHATILKNLEEEKWESWDFQFWSKFRWRFLYLKKYSMNTIHSINRLLLISEVLIFDKL